MADISEQFGASLVRVIKKVKKRSPDGGVQVVKQAFHVRKANPNDQYAAKTGRAGIPPMPKGGKKTVSGAPLLQPGSEPEKKQAAPDPGPPPTRISVRYYDIPWLKKKTRSEKEKEDPIPASLRKRFDKGNRSLQVVNPHPHTDAVVSVMPTDRILWGVDEPDLLGDLRVGVVRKLLVVKPMSGLMLARIEAPRGGSYSAYLWLESLRDPILKSVWGDLISIDDGNSAKRASATYEVAKACGIDDVIPPTVHRFDEDNDLEMVLPSDLIEQKEKLVEWISRETGDDPENIRKRVCGHATVQLVRDRLWTIDQEQWFKDIFSDPGELDKKDVLNNVWANMPPDRRISFLRLAMLDFVSWNLDRCVGDLAFCDNEKHPVIAYGNELTLPCPRQLGLRYASSNIGSYGDSPDSAVSGMALMWNDILTMLAVRGGPEEIEVCEKIGLDIVGRMRGDRAIELARSLSERQLSRLQVAGVLSRIWMLATHSKDVARDPFFAARYYAQIVSGTAPKEMKGVVDFVNKTMRHVLSDDFDFIKRMRSSKEDD